MDIVLLLLLIIFNGMLAMSEIAIVTSRKSRLQKMADENNQGAKSALSLSNAPADFLSTIQVGITTVGILSGAIGETALVDPLTAWLGNFTSIAHYARNISLIIVIAGLTYFSVVIGELIPKQLGLLAPEKTASFIAPAMNKLARIAKPLVWLLSSSSSFLLFLAGAKRKSEPPITDEEIKVLMEQGSEAGIFHESEQAIVSNVLRLDDQRIGTIMTPRNDIYTVDLSKSEEAIRNRIAESPYTRIVVCRNGLDHVVGILRTKDILKEALAGKPLLIEPALSLPLFVPEGISTTNLLENFRKTRRQCALIVDEYGELQGLVTLTDVLTAIVGDIPSANISEEQDVVIREDGSLLIDGGVTIERLKLILATEQALPGEKENIFNTLGGFMMYVLERVPKVADFFETAGYRFEVIDMDKHSVDKVLVTRLTPATPEANSTGA